MNTFRQRITRVTLFTTLALLSLLSLHRYAGNPATATAYFADEDVTWTSLVNTTATANTIRKTGGLNDGSFDGSGVSQQTITNNGTYEFKPAGADVERVTGLTDTPNNKTPLSFDFYINLSEGGIAEFRERDAYIGDTTYVNGDTFRIKLVNGRAEYSKNGILVRTGNLVLNSALNAIASFGQLNGEIGSARLGNITGGPTCAPPVIILGQNNYTVCEGETWFVGAGSVLGTAPITYVWRKNGVVISGNTNVISGTARLSDAGTYSVTVTNACGTATSTTTQTLSVNALSGISPTSNTVPATGGTGTINITSGRNGFGNICSFGWDNPIGQWIPSISRVDGPNGASLVYTALPNNGAARSDVIRVYNIDQTRTFSFTVNQAAGTTTCVAPVLSSFGGTLNVCEGAGWSMGVGATGTRPFTWVWKKNGVIVPNPLDSPQAPSTNLSGTGTLSEAGNYTVTVSNACGTATTTGSIRLNVIAVSAISPTSSTIGAAGGTGTINITTGRSDNAPFICGFEWDPSDAQWITPITRVDTANGPTLVYTASPNTGAARTGTIRIFNKDRSRLFTFTLTQAAGSGGGGNVQDVIWTSLVNTTATGGTIRKTGGANDGSYDGSGVSVQSFSNNGYYEFTVGGANVERVTGLTDTPDNKDFTTFDFYVNLSEGTIAEFRERGQYLGDTVYNVGDVFRITIENGRARYSRNGVVLAYGNATTTAPLKAAAAFSLLNGEVTQAKLGGLTGGCSYAITPTNAAAPASGATGTVAVTSPGGCTWTANSNAAWLMVNSGASGNGNGTVAYTAGANTGAQRTGTITIAGQTFTVTQAAATASSPNVTWTQLVNVTLTGQTLRKTGGADDGSYDGSAVSREVLSGGTGYVEFTVSGPYVRRSIGLSRNYTAGNPSSLDYEINMSDSNVVEFRYRGQYLGDATYKVGDVIRIAVENGRVVAYVNAKAFAETTARPTYPLQVWASFSLIGGEATGAKLYTGRLPVLQQRRTPTGQTGDDPLAGQVSDPEPAEDPRQ